MKFTTFLKKNKLLLLLILVVLLVASYFLFFKKENFQKEQCKRLSCPPNTGLLGFQASQLESQTFDTNHIIERDEEFAGQMELISNICISNTCEQKPGYDVYRWDDFECTYVPRNGGGSHQVRLLSYKPTCEDSRTCTYKEQQRTLASYNSNMKCPTGYTLETYTQNSVVLPRCHRLVNKVNNRCPNGTFETTPASNRCREFRNPICKNSRDTFDKSSGSCLKGSCARGVLFNKWCFICPNNYNFNDTNYKCEKKNSPNLNPDTAPPVCYK